MNKINWFEIPANDLERAIKFYADIFQEEVPIMEMGDIRMGMLGESGPNQLGGGIIQMPEHYEVSAKAGVLIYLNGGENLQVILDRVEVAGGKVIQPKTQISEQIGYMAMFLDSEGNRLALHSPG